MYSEVDLQGYIKKINQQGYAVLPATMDTATLNSEFEKVDVAARAFKQMRPEDRGTEERGGRYPFGNDPEHNGSFIKLQGGGVQFVNWLPGGFGQVWKEITRPPLHLAITRRHFGCDKADHLICQAHFKHPGDGVEFREHTDQEKRNEFGWNHGAGRNSKKSYLVFITAVHAHRAEVEGYDVGNGAIWVKSGSHKFDQKNKMIPELVVPLEPGETLVMDQNLLHGSPPNNSSTDSRGTVIAGYSKPGANIGKYPGYRDGAGGLFSLKTGKDLTGGSAHRVSRGSKFWACCPRLDAAAKSADESMEGALSSLSQR